MGSAGSTAQTRDSDIDIWVCAPPSAHPRLAHKLRNIERLAQEFDIDLQMFAIDPGQFGGGVNMAASPLLLDEFYRSGCWIAGAYPLWWLVPPNHTGQMHLEYIDNLHHNDLLASHRWLDFGPCTSFTNLVLIVALDHELNAGLKNPYKALLKLALLESYTFGAQALSETYKQQVCEQGEVDPYLLLAAHLDRHFTANRLSTLRRAWLAKVTQKTPA